MSAISYKPYLQMKNTGEKWLGEIPVHWDCLNGKRLFRSVRKSAYSSDEQLAASQKYGVVPQSLMMQLNDAKVMLALKGTESFRHVEKDNFVISLRSFEGGIEHSNYVGCVSPAYTVLEPAGGLVKPTYYKYLLKSNPYISALQASTDSLRDGKSISYDQFGRIQLPVPELAEQLDIARFLDHETTKIDTLIEKQQQLIKLLKEKRQAVISHAVTKGLNPDAPMKDSGVEWLGEVPEHWSVVPLRHITPEVTVGIVVTPAKYYVDNGIPCFRSLNVKENSIEERDFVYISKASNSDLIKSQVFQGDILVVRSGQPGKAAVVLAKHDGYNCIDLIIIRKSKKIISDFLCYQINSDVCKKQISSGSGGAIQQHFNVELAKGLYVTFPPLEEQMEISKYIMKQIKAFDSLVKKAEMSIDLMKERRSALISAAVTGKIDVRNWKPQSSANKQPKTTTEPVAIPAAH
ncbi:restriction endonuclease subunit S [Marinobacterium stanieri]|uniref:Type I restriction enzyme, S subunit n=1 Tax=Marinobacterium stanieri TaxID=49186 RepID=A0A1N6R7S9_9GAMM|nr:restriction endonuclease subunit S [Marinobacterium stanieri]SIQ24889.1 type I restriction enzyme, S subunit [Marinobacterium stanieri]